MPVIDPSTKKVLKVWVVVIAIVAVCAAYTTHVYLERAAKRQKSSQYISVNINEVRAFSPGLPVYLTSHPSFLTAS